MKGIENCGSSTRSHTDVAAVLILRVLLTPGIFFLKKNFGFWKVVEKKLGTVPVSRLKIKKSTLRDQLV